VLDFRCYRKSPVCGKNWLKLRISWSWPPYSRSVIHNSHVYDFYRLWIFLNFRSKSIGVSMRFYKKSPLYNKNWPKLHISLSWPPNSVSVIHNGHVYEFSWVIKNFKFSLKIHRCQAIVFRISWPSVLPNIFSLQQKLTEIPYFMAVTPIFQICYMKWPRIWVFTGFKKIHFFAEIHMLPTVLSKIASLRQKLTETLYFTVVAPIFWISYT
jgi:hypothetical protein